LQQGIDASGELLGMLKAFVQGLLPKPVSPQQTYVALRRGGVNEQ
jgi:hypothetical protein